MTDYQKDKLLVKLEYYFNLSGFYMTIVAGILGIITIVTAVVHLINS